jgi:hypothetical protein
MILALSATRLRTVTVTVTQEPENLSDPDAGDTVTLALELWSTKLTGPPTAVTMNVPLAGLPETADSTRLTGTTRSVPGIGDGEGEGEGDGEGEGEGDGEDRTGEGDRDLPGDVLGPVASRSAGDIDALDAPAVGAGLRIGEAGVSAGLDAAVDVSKVARPSATAEAWGWCGPPVSSRAAIPPTTTAAATAATAATTRGCRRTSCHHRGPGRMTGFGKPVGPNGPARCVTLTR